MGVFFLDSFYGCIVSCLSAKTMVGANVGRSENRMGPRTQVQRDSQTNMQKCLECRDKKSSKVCPRLKSCESLYTYPRTPFYKVATGLLHSEITLESKEYAKCEHVHECLLHLVICRANSTYLQASH
jgi:hypothetical protein